MSRPEILILYYSRGGHTEKLARIAARGVELGGATARLRTVASLHGDTNDDRLLVQRSDLAECVGLLLGSPSRFGSMAAPLKAFFETTSAEWLSGALVGKPAGVFSSSASMHGGNEATLLGMMLPLLHHGMLLVGLPYSEAALQQSQGGGTPYGASHVELGANDQLREGEKELARALGLRVAQIALKLG